MKTTIISLFACILSIQSAFAQQSDRVHGQTFIKQITYNMSYRDSTGEGTDNTLIKDHLDNTLFGRNHLVEYAYINYDDVPALTIRQDKQAGTYIVEIMRMVDSKKKLADIEWSIKEMPLPDSIPDDKMATLYEFSALTAEKKYQNRSADEVMTDILRNMGIIWGGEPPFSRKTPADSIISFAEFKEAVKHRNSQLKMNPLRMRVYLQYHPEPMTFLVTEDFALKLHDKIMRLIRDFKAVKEGEETRPVSHSGFKGNVTARFRCIVKDELWSLHVHIPQQKAREMSNLLNSMITEAELWNYIDEEKYNKMLDAIDL